MSEKRTWCDCGAELTVGVRTAADDWKSLYDLALAENERLRQERDSLDELYQGCASENEKKLDGFTIEEWRSIAKQREQSCFRLTEKMDEHPEDYDGPCMCALCRSYG